MSHFTIPRDEVVADLQTCKTHDRPATFAVSGRDFAHVACDTPGCRQDAEAAHRVECGAGYLPTRRYTITDPEAETA